MIRRFLILLAVASVPASAQQSPVRPGSALVMGRAYGVAATPPSYAGPGDLKTYAAWGGLRAYSAATRGTSAVNLCNAGTCANVASDAITGLVPNAPTINGAACNNSSHICTVAEVFDQTGNGFHWLQATTGNQPTWVVSASGLGSGLPAMLFGAAIKMSTSGSFVSSQPITAVAVGIRTGNFTGENDIFQTTSGSNSSLGWGPSTANTVFIFSGSLVTTAASDSVYHSMQFVLNGSSCSIAIDATTTSGLSCGSNSWNSPIAVVGSNSLIGSMQEWGIAASAFSGSDNSALSAQDRAVWGF